MNQINTAHRIKIMQEFLDKKPIQFKNLKLDGKWKDCACPEWNWHDFDYRVKVKMVDIGSRWKANYSGHVKCEYILAQVGSDAVALINLANGTRWNDPVEVEIIHEELIQSITMTDFRRVLARSNSSVKFTSLTSEGLAYE